MRKMSLTVAAVMAAVLSMTACGSSVQPAIEETVTTEAASVEETTTVEESETEESVTEETQTATEGDESARDEIQFGGLNTLLSKSVGTNSKINEEKNLAQTVNLETGFISYDADEVSDLLEASGISVEELSQSMIDISDIQTTVYQFAMYNEDSVQELQSSNGVNEYVTALEYEDEEFIVLFGEDTMVEYEDVLPYCEVGTTMEYWAFGVEMEGKYILVPFAAGNEENGYYVVRPVLEMTGEDVSDMMTLEEQGISFAEDANKDANKDAEKNKKNATNSTAASENDFIIEITSVEDLSDMMTVQYKLSSNYSENVYFDDEKFVLNGVDITDSVTSYFEVDAYGKTEDQFYLNDNIKLHKGDELVISAMVASSDTYEEIDRITFDIVME